MPAKRATGAKPRQTDKSLVGRLCRLNRDIPTAGGVTYKSGTLCRIGSTWRGTFDLEAPERKEVGTGSNRVTLVKTIVAKASRYMFDLLEEGAKPSGAWE